MKNIVTKIKARLPKGELYEVLRAEKRMIEREQDPFCKKLMLALYKAKKDIFWRGGRLAKKEILFVISIYTMN